MRLHPCVQLHVCFTSEGGHRLRTEGVEAVNSRSLLCASGLGLAAHPLSLLDHLRAGACCRSFCSRTSLGPCLDM